MTSRWIPVVAMVAIALAGLTLAWTSPWIGPEPDPGGGPSGKAPPRADPRWTGVSPDTADKRPLPPERDLLPPEPSDFDSLLDRLVELGTRLTAAVEDGDRELAEALDGEGRGELQDLQRSVRNPGEQALYRLASLDPSVAAVPDRVRRKVLMLLVTRSLEDRSRQAQATASPGRLDAFVSSILQTLPQGEELARDLGGLLVGSSHVGLAHEDQVLDLVALSTEQPFLRETSADLLLTLWDNLGRSGARSSSELTSLALLFKDDTNPSKRLAALKLLLTAQDGRYRDVILDEVCDRRERGVAEELGLAAVQILDPEDALSVLRRVTTVTTDGIAPAYLALGQRAPGMLRTAYETSLADGMDAGMRAELVTGAGFSRAGGGVELARLAFRADPDPAVRSRAMFVLTAHAGAEIGEEVLISALDELGASQDPRRLGEIVLGLENLANRGLANAVHRLGERLLSRSDLLPGDRERLASLLAHD